MAEQDGILLSDRDRLIVARVLAPFAARLSRVDVFGSRARNMAEPASDIDLALWGDVDDAMLARLHSRFLDSSLAVTVDLVRYDNTLAPALRRHIDAVGRTLFDRTALQALAAYQQ